MRDTAPKDGGGKRERVRRVIAPNPGPLTLAGTVTYVVGESRLVVLDPGPVEPTHLEAVEGAVQGRTVEAVYLTHSHGDHAAAAEVVAARFSCPVRASAETLERCRIEGEPLADGDATRVDDDPRALVAIETPGHSSDHICYLLRPERFVFTGDLVLGEGSSVVLHPDGEMGAYLTSLARLAALRPARIYPGHGPPVPGAVAKLEEYRRHRLERERQIVAAVRGGARTVEEIRETVYGIQPPELARAAAASIRAHLELLRSRGEDLPPMADGGGSE